MRRGAAARSWWWGMRWSAFSLLLLLAAAPAVVGQGAAGGDASAAYSRQGADTCLLCHEDEVTLGVFRTPHGVPGNNPSPFGHGQLQCEACHGPGGAHSGRVPKGEARPAILSFSDRYPADVTVENGMCLTCHQDAVGAGWHGGAHAAQDVGCADCHSSHAPRDPVLQTATQPQVCYECHQVVRGEANKAFTHPFRQGKMDCSSCHSLHGDNVATQFVRQTLNDTCYQCHAQTRGPFLWEHAPVSEDCSLCHSPHGSIHPGMLSRRGPLLCQSCHSQAGHPSVAYDTDDLPSGTASKYLLGQNCLNCHTQVHGSNHPSGSRLMR
jgi:DmsE family decaheme c-type cytochrome